MRSVLLLIPAILAGCAAPQEASVAVETRPVPSKATVSIGMDSREVLSKFGKPDKHLESTVDGHLVETWAYGTIAIGIDDGKVMSVRPYKTGRRSALDDPQAP